MAIERRTANHQESIYSPKGIELSEATAFELFLYKGTKAAMDDLIIYKETV